MVKVCYFYFIVEGIEIVRIWMFYRRLYIELGVNLEVEFGVFGSFINFGYFVCVWFALKIGFWRILMSRSKFCSVLVVNGDLVIVYINVIYWFIVRSYLFIRCID